MVIAFIGGGQMASALIGGLIAAGRPASELLVAEPQPQPRELLRARFGVSVSSDTAAVAGAADTLVLAVKPQQMATVAGQLAGVLGGRRRLLLSVAAGLRIADLARGFGAHAIVRTMPNRPALIGAGITALCAAPDVDAGERRIADDIMRACGATVWLEDESQLDAVTAISGSGPAYFFLLIEALESAGIDLGLDPSVARRLAVETAQGAGRLAATSDEAPALLRAAVTSRGGTTEAALAVIEAAGVRAIFAQAVRAAARRSAELAVQLSGP
jgi:pyrroline-5-carboxylate reductase